MPRGMKAPNDWPAEPWKRKVTVPGGRPAAPWRRVSSEPVMVPTTRLVLRMGRVASTLSPRASAGSASLSSVVASRLRSTPWSCGMVQVRP